MMCNVALHSWTCATGIPLGDAPVSAALPRCRPSLTTADLPWLVGDLPSQRGRFSFWRRTLDRSRPLRWLLANTFPGEGSHSLLERSPGPRIFHVGPLTSQGVDGGGGLVSFWEEDGSCVEWLDTLPRGSVVYVSFGSWVGPVGVDSVAELALGLEATRRPFLWVLGDSCRKGLPEGYLDRVAGRGKLVKWAPQREVLRHAAVGCFLTHCGWNSTVEAVEFRKRLLCYPVSGDQFVNCKNIVEVWGVGLRLEGLRRREVEEGVGRAMGVAEGEELQRRVDEMNEGINGGLGRARAVAELVAFVEELKGGRAEVVGVRDE